MGVAYKKDINDLGGQLGRALDAIRIGLSRHKGADVRYHAPYLTSIPRVASHAG